MLAFGKPDAPNVSSQWSSRRRGPYGLVRHPIYLGWFLIVFAVGTMTMTRFVFAVVSCVYILVAIPFEERSIRASSGEAYDGYMKKVRLGNSSPDSTDLLVVVLLRQTFQFLEEDDRPV